MSELKNVPHLSVLGQDNSNLFHANEQADTQTALPADLAQHKAFSRVFQKDQLTIGLIEPFKGYPDVGQGLDPFVSLGYLAARTKNIALGTTGIVSPLREPIHIAKI